MDGNPTFPIAAVAARFRQPSLFDGYACKAAQDGVKCIRILPNLCYISGRALHALYDMVDDLMAIYDLFGRLARVFLVWKLPDAQLGCGECLYQ